MLLVFLMLLFCCYCADTGNIYATAKRVFLKEELSIKVIMDCRTTAAHKFETRLRFKQYDVILSNEQSVLAKIRSSFEREIM